MTFARAPVLRLLDSGFFVSLRPDGHQLLAVAEVQNVGNQKDRGLGVDLDGLVEGQRVEKSRHLLRPGLFVFHGVRGDDAQVPGSIRRPSSCVPVRCRIPGEPLLPRQRKPASRAPARRRLGGSLPASLR